MQSDLYQWLLNIISFIGFYWIRFQWNHRYRHTDRVLYRNESIMGGVFYGYGSMGTTLRNRKASYLIFY